MEEEVIYTLGDSIAAVIADLLWYASNNFSRYLKENIF